jgi:hypothetical protein
MQDAVILANHLYDIYPTSFENIKTALNDYKEERFDAIKDQYPQSYVSAKLMYGHVSNTHLQSIFTATPYRTEIEMTGVDDSYLQTSHFIYVDD